MWPRINFLNLAVKMAKHVWEWDRRSSKPMMVVCARCGARK
ncbi:unnamed protein product, partial [marine sediment metagenome]